MRKAVLSCLFSFLILASCEEVVEWGHPGDPPEGIAVQAILTDEYKNQEIFLWHLSGELNGQAVPLTGAQISVFDGQQVFPFHEGEMKDGSYASNEAFAITLSTRYELTIEWMDKLFEAESMAVAGTPMTLFTFAREEGTDSMFIRNIGVDYHPEEQSMYVFDVDWSHLQHAGKTHSKMVHYVFNSVNIGQLFGPAKEKVLFPRGSQVVRRKYALEEHFANYLRELVIETQFKGGFFEESAGNLHSNLSNGAYGYFAACSVQSDTLIAE